MSRLSTKQRRSARRRRAATRAEVRYAWNGNLACYNKRFYQSWLCDVLTTKSDLLDLIQRSQENMIRSGERAMGSIYYG